MSGLPSRQADNPRKPLGCGIAVLGIVLIITGIQSERATAQEREKQRKEWMAGQRRFEDLDHGPPAGFFMIGAGMFAIFIGLAVAFAQSSDELIRQQAQQLAPIIRETQKILDEEHPPAVPQESGPAEAMVLADPGESNPSGSSWCSRCRTANVRAARYCKGCGQVLGCPDCGRVNDGDARFCNHCGSKLA